MTVIAHVADTSDVNETAGSVAVEPVRMADGGRMIMRGAQRLSGAALVIAALGLWFAPGAITSGEVVLFKLVLSLSAIMAGLGLLHAGGAKRSPEIEIDTIRRQIRVVRREPGSEPVVLQTCSFAQLSAAEFDGALVRLWDQAGTLLAEVSLKDRNALTSLVGGLRDEGKLA